MLERLRHPRDERGVVAIMVALITCFMLIPIAAYAVDLGIQRVARSDAQSVADTVALDMSRQLDGRTYDQLMSASPSMQTLADKSAARSSNSGTGLKVTLEFGTLNKDNFHPGTDSANYFTPATSGTPDAVRVSVSAKVGFTFIGGSGGVSRTAIGNAAHHACVTMDSYAAAIRTSESALLNGEWAIGAGVNDTTASVVLAPLNKILGTNLDTTVLGSSGILTADLDVLSFLNVLKTNLGVGSVDEVLTSHVTAAQVVAAEMAVLNADGASLAAQALQSQIASHISSSNQILVSDLLGLPGGVGVSQGGASALEGSVNPFDLAAAAVQVANGTSAVAVSASGANLTGLTASATVGSHPQPVCLNNGRQEMEQTSLQAIAKLDQSGTLSGSLLNLTTGLTNALGSLLCVLPLPGATCYSDLQISDINLNAKVGLAQAAATVTGLTCKGNGKADVTVLEESALAPATVGLSFTITMKKTVRPLIGAAVVTYLNSTVTTSITTATPADKATTATFTAPDDYDAVKAGPNSNLSITGLTVSGNTSTTVGGDAELNTRFGGVTAVLNNVNSIFLAPLLGSTIEPLLTSLTSSLKSLVGLTIAGSSYTLQDPTDCVNPRLAG